MLILCRDCGTLTESAGGRCARCHGLRLVQHRELDRLTIGHIDCDAFYASVEKRDRPELAAKPVIVGGGRRGVVTAACYVARIHGVRSAMPMFKALRACPDAVVIPPDFRKYSAVAREIRELMAKLTPLVQPLSIDEAVLDLSGTERLHGAPPAAVLARFALEVERRVGITVSIGLAANRLIAKIAAGRDKPRGFSVIGSEVARVLAPLSVRALPGIGPAFAQRLATLGLTELGQLQALDEKTALQRLGRDGPALVRRARGEDNRVVDPARAAVSISAETTFEHDLTDLHDLERELWRITEKLARRLAAAQVAASGVTLKLRTADFKRQTRATRLHTPTGLPDVMFEVARGMLAREADGRAFRLIGIAAAPLAPAAMADAGDLLDTASARRAAAHRAIEQLRSRYGREVVTRGRELE